MKTTTATTLLLSMLLSGCASTRTEYQVPVPMHHAKEYQTQLQSVRHWDIIADDVAQQSMQEISKRELGLLPVRVVAESEDSPFGKALHEFLVTRMFNKGINLAQTTAGTLSLQYNVQAVHFMGERSNPSRPYIVPGSVTALTAGVLVFHDAAEHITASLAKANLLTGAVAADLLLANNEANRNKESHPIPNMEIIVTTSLVMNGSYIMRRSDIYYVNDPDHHLYQAPVARKPAQRTLMDAIREYDEERHGRFN